MSAGTVARRRGRPRRRQPSRCARARCSPLPRLSPRSRLGRRRRSQGRRPAQRAPQQPPARQQPPFPARLVAASEGPRRPPLPPPGQPQAGFPNRPPRGAPWPEPGVGARPPPANGSYAEVPPAPPRTARPRPQAAPHPCRVAADTAEKGLLVESRAAPHARRRAGAGRGAHRPRPDRWPDRGAQRPRRGTRCRATADARAVGAPQGAGRRLLDRAGDARDAMGRQRQQHDPRRLRDLALDGGGAPARSRPADADGIGAHRRPRRPRGGSRRRRIGSSR